MISLRYLVALFVLFVGLIPTSLMGQSFLGGVSPTGRSNLLSDDKTISSFVEPQTLAVAHINIEKIDEEAVVKVVEKFLDGAEEGTKKVLEAIRSKRLGSSRQLLLRMGIKDIYTVASYRDPFRSPAYAVVPLKEERDAMLLKTFLGFLPKVKTAVIRKCLVIANNEATLAHLKGLQSAPSQYLSDAFARTEGSAARVVLLLPANVSPAMSEVIPRLPQEWGGLSVKPLTHGFHYGVLSVKLTPKLVVKVEVESKNPNAARQLQKVLAKILSEAIRTEGVQQVLPGVEKVAAQVESQVVKKSIVLTIKEKDIVAVVAPLAKKFQIAVKRSQSQNNLKLIGLAMHNYLDTHGTFPPAATFDKQEQPLLSWRVHVLPYLNQNELYKQFKLDEPWDSPHNKKLIAKMPKVFRRAGSAAGRGETTYLVPVGKNTIFGVKDGCKILTISDGTSNTILAVDVDDKSAVIWTKPEDLKVDKNNPKRGMLGHKQGFNVLFADGSVRSISKTIDAKVLRGLMTRNGGEIVNID
ncbi:MAG: DUF1559 domain-containing protein [Gemmataceae bacterium]